MKRIMVINGPNLNMLGTREKGVYGEKTLEEINALIEEETKALAVELDFVQSNHEGDIVDEIQAAHYDGLNGIVLNAGAYTHYSYAIRDAIAAIDVPVVEVHLSDIHAREAFRNVSVIEEVCVAQIAGLGYKGYVKAVELLEKEKEGEGND